MNKAMREKEERYGQTNNRNPSFSSSLLDQIYRSFDSDGESHNTLEDSRFYSSNPVRKQTKVSIERAKTEAQRLTSEFDHLHHHQHYLLPHPDIDQDSIFFSSGSSSSDSSSSVFSSSDTELMYASRSASSFCVAPPRPRPVRTGGSAKTEKTEKRKQNTLSHCKSNISDSNCCGATKQEENNLIKSKSRAMKIYNNLKKVKQPISPGGRFASFINSLFTATNIKKSSVRRYSGDGFIERSQDSIKSDQVSTCDSASSYSRSCLSKHSPSTREKLRNGQKRSVRFYPVSVIVGEDSRPCGHKSLYQDEVEEKKEVNYRNGSRNVSVSVVNAWQIGKSAARKSRREEEDVVRVSVMEKSRRVEEMAREILREYEKKRMKEYGVTRNSPIRRRYEDDGDDDAMSCSSSELFELDLVGSGRFGDELPVYETTHVETNRAIASGLIM